ncbi:hypothetical protein BHE74_00002313 [Ensete ventricosum]|nr:hypothetical protein BHE74_00002313 [Ensete ventricosum]
MNWLFPGDLAAHCIPGLLLGSNFGWDSGGREAEERGGEMRRRIRDAGIGIVLFIFVLKNVLFISSLTKSLRRREGDRSSKHINDIDHFVRLR